MISPVRVFRSIPPRTPLPIVRPSRLHPTSNKTRLPRGRQGILHSVSGESSEASSTQGQMSSELINSMRSKIQEALSAESVEVVDVEGDGQHVTINVISSTFEGELCCFWTPPMHCRQIECRSTTNGVQGDLVRDAKRRSCR